MSSASTCSTTLRRLTGPEAGELALLCRPEGQPSDTLQQAEEVYGTLAALLAAEGASFRHLTCETLFLRDIGRDLPLLLDARKRILADIGQSALAPRPAFIQQAPLDQRARFELSASAVVPRAQASWEVRDIQAMPSCECEGCAQTGARLVRLAGQTSLHTTNLYGVGENTSEQTWNAFRAAERLLEQCDMDFKDVVRCWLHLRDIDRDYDTLNQARREFFRQRGIECRPASTGIQGIPFPDVHDVSLSLYAVKSAQPLELAVMSTPTLNEAWTYGADFSRGVRLAEANKVALYISGTASIDEAGRTVHAGDFRAQVDRMLHNIASLLARQGASFEDLVSGVTYLKNPKDAPVLRSMFRRHAFDGFPCALVEAPLCRPDLLCEAEAVALLPLATKGA